MKMALLVLTLFASPVSASTFFEPTPYIPGGAPCNDDCDVDTARAAYGVPDGVFAEKLIPAGSVVHKMAYAKAHVAYYVDYNSYFFNDAPAYGYMFAKTETSEFWFVTIDACSNPAVVEIFNKPKAATGSSILLHNPYDAVTVTLAGWVDTGHGYDIWTGPLWPSPQPGVQLPPEVDTVPWVPVFPVTPETPDTPTIPGAPIIPLPASFYLLGAALLGLGLVKKLA